MNYASISFEMKVHVHVYMHVSLDLSIFNLVNDFGNFLIVNQLLTDMTMISKCHMRILTIL